MDQSPSLSGLSAIPNLRDLPWHWISLVGAVLASAMICSVFSAHTADVTWLLQVGDRVLAGEHLYVDVRESNPPFSVALYLPFAFLEDVTGLSAHVWTTFGLYSVLACSLLLSNSVLRNGLKMTASQRRIFMIGLTVISTIALPMQFAQREHFGIIAGLPFLFLIAAQLQTNYRPALSVSVVCGLLAAILIMVKPLYALGFGLPVLYLFWQRRSLWSALSPQNIAVAVPVLLYAVILIAFFSIYLETITPILVDIYLPHRQGLTALISALLLPIILPAVIILIANGTGHRLNPVSLVFMLAAAGFSVAFVMSGKGWLYHLYPAIVAILISGLALAQSKVLSDTKRMALICAGIASLALTAVSDVRQAGPALSVPNSVTSLTAEPRLTVMTLDIGLSAPLAHQLNADWRELNHSDYVGGLALAQLDQGNYQRRQKLRAYIQSEIDQKLDYLNQTPSDLIVLDTKSQFWLDMLLGDARMASHLQAYEEMARDDRVIYLARKDR